MTNRYRFFLAGLAVIGVALIPACYTLMEHPRLASLDYARPDDKRCTNCHSSEETWAFTHGSTEALHRSYSEAWIKYYDTPWWYGKLWDYHPHVDKENKQNERENRD